MSKFIKIAIIPLVILVAAVIAVVEYEARQEYPAADTTEVSKELTIVDNNGTVKAVYQLEFARTRDEMSKGLMNRESLDADSGMLFDLRQVKAQTAMWMKDTHIALDMLFIDPEGMIFWIYENAEPESTKLIIPPYYAASVLEINGGDVQKHNIKIGDNIKHDWFVNSAQAESTKTENKVEDTSDVEASAAKEQDAIKALNETVENIKQTAEDVMETAKGLTSEAAAEAQSEVEEAADKAVKDIEAAN